jgi:predicted hydrocarbon binding protein
LSHYNIDQDNGIIRDKLTGQRCLVINERALQSVFQALSKIFNSGIEVLLEESSSASGRQMVESIDKGARTDVKSSLSAYMRRLTQQGYGRFEISELELEAARMRIRVWNGIFAEMREKKSTYCTYVAGLLSGIYEGLLHASPKVSETKCIRYGDPYCEFLLTLKGP